MQAPKRRSMPYLHNSHCPLQQLLTLRISWFSSVCYRSTHLEHRVKLVKGIERKILILPTFTYILTFKDIDSYVLVVALSSRGVFLCITLYIWQSICMFRTKVCTASFSNYFVLGRHQSWFFDDTRCQGKCSSFKGVFPVYFLARCLSWVSYKPAGFWWGV